MYWSVGNVKESMHILHRARSVVLGVVIWPCFQDSKTWGYLQNFILKKLLTDQSSLQSDVKYI